MKRTFSNDVLKKKTSRSFYWSWDGSILRSFETQVAQVLSHLKQPVLGIAVDPLLLPGILARLPGLSRAKLGTLMKSGKIAPTV